MLLLLRRWSTLEFDRWRVDCRRRSDWERLTDDAILVNATQSQGMITRGEERMSGDEVDTSMVILCVRELCFSNGSPLSSCLGKEAVRCLFGQVGLLRASSSLAVGGWPP